MYSSNNKKNMVYTFSFSDIGMINQGNIVAKREYSIQKSYE